MSWDYIQEFLKKLNQKTGKNYRLPTEAEWEFAARSDNKAAILLEFQYSVWVNSGGYPKEVSRERDDRNEYEA